MIKTSLILLGLTILSGLQLLAQNPGGTKNAIPLSGRIIDNITGDPISEVHIFIPNTTIGAATDSDGKFDIKNPVKGSFELIITHISYEIAFKRISYQNEPLWLDIKLKPKDYQLDEVVVKNKKDRNWNRLVKVFEKELLGSSKNAANCSITNPWVLDFDYDEKKDYLIATAQDLVIIENKALGYKVGCQLMVFEKEQDNSRYLCNSFFEELETSNFAQKRKWEKARKKVYQGSSKHFFDAIMDDDLKKNGFKISLIDNSVGAVNTNAAKRSPELDELFFPRKGGYSLQLNGKVLHIEYFRGMETRDYLVYKQSKLVSSEYLSAEVKGQLNTQQSMLQPVFSNIDLDLDGSLTDPMAVVMHGFWGFKRMADELPINYTSQK